MYQPYISVYAYVCICLLVQSQFEILFLYRGIDWKILNKNLNKLLISVKWSISAHETQSKWYRSRFELMRR